MLGRLELSLEHAQWLEEQRKIPSDIAVQAGVRSRGDNLAFEYRRNGACSFLKLRTPDKKFWIEPAGSELFFWNEDVLSERPADQPIIVTEGEFDTLSCLAVGETCVVSVPNGAAGKPGEGDIDPTDDRQFACLWDGPRLKAGLAEATKVILMTDDDKAGRILRDELAVRLGRTRCWFVTYPSGCKDANDVLIEYGPDTLREVIADARPMVPDRLVPFSDIPSRADAPRYSTGWSGLDAHMMLVPPQLIIVTGKPNHGKSQWTLAVAANTARLHGFKWAILQFEDNPERNRRDLIRYARAWKGQERSGIQEDPEAWVDRMFRTIAPSEDLEADYDLKWLDAVIEEAVTRHGCRGVLVDPWNEVEHLWDRQDTEATYLNRALRHLKRLARRFQIAIVIVAHPTAVGGRVASIEEANLYDINGGAVWNNKADLGVIVWADETASLDRHVKIAKSKDFQRMGRPGIVRMRFAPERASFECVGLRPTMKRTQDAA
jgi:twinkle protein